MRFEMKTLSYTAIGSGEGAGIIDTELVAHADGLPYIPAKRIKGVLLESATEVTEMLGIERDRVESLFGVTGTSKGKVWIGNLEVKNYEEISRELKYFKSNKLFKGLTNKEKILSHFSDTRQNTSIDLETEIAMEHTLRTFRVLKPGIVFEAAIEVNSPLTEAEKALLYLACLNVRRIGLKRNRGFGKVKAAIKGIDFKSIDQALEFLNKT
ncbi:MAG TPA: RAMP superfamily CRISPR-associated protein, partial [Mesotoga sp.]|nr:RAMP superfamily CRISPR-associated protein [Mesotoga sp.]